jgi:zinc/manganese transport system substrate-binding protein
VTRKWLLLLACLLAPVARADLAVFACEPEWGALARALGGERVSVRVATTARQDPHRIEARPSLIAAMRRADLAICSGAELEIGWLPLLQRRSGNPAVQAGAPGMFLAAEQVQRLGIPDKVDRSMGDVHPSGNPHVHLDPRRLARIAEHLGARMARLDPGHGDHYRDRTEDFLERWAAALEQWQVRARALRGMRVVVHHDNWPYLEEWLGLQRVAELEPKPGVPPSPSHIASLRERAGQADVIVRAAYVNPRPSERLAELTGVPAIELPYTVGGADGADDLFGLFAVTLERLESVRR